jgi:hypothetical protein
MVMEGDIGKRAGGGLTASELALWLDDRFAPTGGMLTNVGIPIEIRGGALIE